MEFTIIIPDTMRVMLISYDSLEQMLEKMQVEIEISRQDAVYELAEILSANLAVGPTEAAWKAFLSGSHEAAPSGMSEDETAARYCAGAQNLIDEASKLYPDIVKAASLIAAAGTLVAEGQRTLANAIAAIPADPKSEKPATETESLDSLTELLKNPKGSA